MGTSTPPKIFLSYAWANKNIADEIDNHFRQVGFTFQRDVRDINYTGSIKDFMNRIGKSDFVVMLISEEYIKSENCMFEVTELLGAHEFEQRILPVIVNTSAFFTRTEQEKYYEYWKKEELLTIGMYAKYPNEKTSEDKKKITSINENLGVFFQKITDLKLETFNELKNDNYKLMFDKIGFQHDEDVIEKLVSLSAIENDEDRQIAFEDILEIYPKNVHALFYKARSAHERMEYRKAKRYYENVLREHPSFVQTHYNLAVLLASKFYEYKQAKSLLETAIEMDPQYAEARDALAVIIEDNLA